MAEEARSKNAFRMKKCVYTIESGVGLHSQIPLPYDQ